MPLNPYASIGFLSGSGLSTTDTEGRHWVNLEAVLPGSGLWNPNPPNAFTGNPNPPNSLTGNPNPPAGKSMYTGNPNPPNAPRWPLPTQAPPPRIGVDPDWVFSNPNSLLGQALRRSAARIEQQPAPGKVRATQAATAAQRGSAAGVANLWRWGPEFRAKAVAAELLGRFQVTGTTLWVLDRANASTPQVPRIVLQLPASLSAAGISLSTQVDKVLRAAVEREDRLSEILTQLDDFWPFFESITGLSLDRAPRTAQLLAAAHDWLLHPLMHLKHAFAQARPVQVNSLVVPMIPTPGHGSLPSGHATQAAFTSELLHILLYRSRKGSTIQRRSEQLDRLARRIAFNRVVAGVHFPADSLAGYQLGTQMARVLAALAQHGAGGKGAALMPAPRLAADTLDSGELLEGGTGAQRPPEQPSADPPLEPCELLAELWKQVTIELGELSI